LYVDFVIDKTLKMIAQSLDLAGTLIFLGD